MIPMPQEVRERWARGWPDFSVPERPWWRRPGQRCDGIELVRLSQDHPPASMQNLRGAYRPWIEDVASAMERIDREYPIPPPEPLEGQVWAQVEGAGRFLDGGDSFMIVSMLRTNPIAVVQGNYEPKLAVLRTWPPPGAVLVAGPTPWGRDIPWSPSEVRLQDTRA